jgi:hypothetical protein
MWQTSVVKESGHWNILVYSGKHSTKMLVYIYASSWIWNHDPKIPKLQVIISL